MNAALHGYPYVSIRRRRGRMSPMRMSSDVEIQDQYDVDYQKYWFNQDAGKLFCLVEAPSAEAAQLRPSRSPWPARRETDRGRSRPGRQLHGRIVVNDGGAACRPGATPSRARPRRAHRDVHRHRRLDRNVLAPRRRRRDRDARRPRPHRPRRAGQQQRARGQAHRRRHHGRLQLGGRRGALRLPDPGRAARP